MMIWINSAFVKHSSGTLSLCEFSNTYRCSFVVWQSERRVIAQVFKVYIQYRRERERGSARAGQKILVMLLYYYFTFTPTHMYLHWTNKLYARSIIISTTHFNVCSAITCKLKFWLINRNIKLQLNYHFTLKMCNFNIYLFIIFILINEFSNLFVYRLRSFMRFMLELFLIQYFTSNIIQFILTVYI